MGLAAAPPTRPAFLGPAALFALATLSGGPALADRALRSNAVVEIFTCANLLPDNDINPEAMHQIGRAVALVHNRGALPPGSERARVVLRLCFNKSLGQPIIEVTDYSGPVGDVADATQKAAMRSLERALAAGTLTKALGALSGGKPEAAVVDLVFGPAQAEDPRAEDQ